jgi:signal transduction histidine kinase
VLTAAEQIVQTATSLATKVEKERKITRLLGTGTEPEPLEITSACHTAVKTAEEEYPALATTLTLPDEVFVEAIPEIRSALIELVRNAVEHNDTDTPEVSIGVTTERENVRIRVSDNGPGIPEMETNILTNDDTITPLYHGSGLGLWFVHLVVRKSDGDISVKVDESRGSRVEVSLPAKMS